jgi:N-acyl-D-aspartate/D-glutamate deacylase
MIDTFVYATSLLGPIVRDGYTTLEEAVRLLTDVPAKLYGVHQRGLITPGFQADLLIFDDTRIGPGKVHLQNDMPGDTPRLYSQAEGIEHVFVNGVETVRAGALTGATPGTVLRSGRDTRSVRVSRSPATTTR